MKSSLETFSTFLRRFSSGTMISRCSGFAREVVMATLFGASSFVANFWMAFRFAHLLRRFFAEGAMHVSFLPHFIQLKEKNPKEAAYFFYEVTLWVSLLLLGIVIVTDLFIGAFLLWGEIGASTREILMLTLLFSPSLIFICLYGLNCSFLHTENHFFVSSVTPSIVNIVWVIAAFFVCKYESSALERLAIMIVFGFALQYVATLPIVVRFISEHKNFSDRDLSKRIRKELREMIKPFFYAIMGVMATQLNSALDMLFAKFVSPEGPAYLWYALRLQQLPLALFGVGLATVLLPALSKNMDRLHREKVINFALNKACVLMVPITVFFGIMGGSTVDLVFGHGQFTSTASIETTKALFMYSLALLPMTMVMILASWFYARKETKLPALCGVISVVVNMILNAVFTMGFGWGAESIALATTISAFINTALLSFFVFKEGIKLFSGSGLMWSKLIIATVLASFVTKQLGGWLGDQEAIWTQIRNFCLLSGIFSGIFIVTSHLLSLREFTELYARKV